MRAIDGTSFTNFTATPAAFTLAGGKYAVVLSAGTWGASGKIELDIVDPVAGSISTGVSGTANNYGTVDLPRGSFKFTVSGTITAGNAVISRIPGE